MCGGWGRRCTNSSGWNGPLTVGGQEGGGQCPGCRKIWRSSVTERWRRSRAWDLLHQAADIRADDDLRNQAAATLSGFDAKMDPMFKGGGRALAFGENGKRLLVGGLKDTPARLWDRPGVASRASPWRGE